jgi:hypothetical protein
MDTRVGKRPPLMAAKTLALAWLSCVAAQTGCEPRSSEPFTGSAPSYLSEMAGESQLATWTCTDSPCPWGESVSNHALAWPGSAEPVATRLGYTVSPAAYLPADSANGITISIELGSATVYAGEPLEESHHVLATISSGESYQISGVLPGEVLSVQSDVSFEYRVTPSVMGPPDAGTPPDADTPPDAGTPPDASNPPDAGTPPDAGPPPDASNPPDAGTPSDAGTASQVATWTCTGSPCPWGSSLSGHALVWPAAAEAINTRLGYTVSAGVYLPAARANGADLSIETGEASAYAGFPNADSHRLLATVTSGQTFHVSGLASGEVLSVQADAEFTYRATLPPPGDPGDPDPPGDVIQATQAFWRCNAPDCFGDDWTGAVITWPAWAAYHSNGRSGNNQSRSVFSADGTPLYPYMGAWAQGCEVTAESGTVLIIEWQRGTDVWRETWLTPRQSHVITLVPPEDGAMIETDDNSPGFSVSLKNCTPQPIPQ